MLSDFLSDAFPGINDTSTADECWVAKAILSQHQALDVFSEALEEVERLGELLSFETKRKREHPLDPAHNPQYDARARDILTEACAFAWASYRGLGIPRFSDCEGTPDIHLDTGIWIEVKAVHHSQEEDERMKRMLAGEVDSGQVTPPNPGLYKKFSDSLKDAVQKFTRQGNQEASGPNIVFFNLTGLDTPQMPITETVLDYLQGWADECEKTLREAGLLPEVRVVICHSYQWKEPFRDPFDTSHKLP